MTFLDDPHSTAYARATGVAYLTIAVAGGLAILAIPAQLTAPGEALPSLDLIAANRGLHAVGLGFDALMMVAEVFATALLFFMFRATNPTLSLAAALSRFAMVAVMAAMLFFQAGRLALIEVPSLASADAAPAIDAVLARMHFAGVGIWQLFFWVHLMILGWLVRASGRFPVLIGWGLTIGGFGYLADTVLNHLWPAPWLELPTMVLLGIVTLSEIGFALWLLIMGQRAASDVTGRRAAAL
ncbi:DUF4386 domain-containing protein [Pseudaestuariivita atlantica]|uniref:DUF4386 domain-containing protein n=1 Tax=Pseudaestuariivita atlantica TaxID=1317121 RepID=A0A0L1JRJ2_9RHOB|nr:DUF4386 domain-containing protein [Pseudaestuariivita atlantica]KNG94337.1 hypothetical protein ATO11_09055 [Pseudaestuariivita atlantica]